MFLYTFPANIQQNIFSFLSKKDIFNNLSATCKQMKLMIEDPIMLIDILKRTIPSFNKQKYLQNKTQYPFKNQYNPNQLKKLVQSSLDNTYELPFWGFRTNGGLSQNHLKYWIGKAFSQSKDQLIATALTSKVFVEGSISFDIIQYKSLLLTMAKYLQKHTSMTESKLKFREINITQVFDQALQKRQDLNQDQMSEDAQLFLNTLANFLNYVSALYSYYQNMNNSDYHNINIQPYSIPKILAHVQRIDISREGYFQNPLKTFLILGSLQGFEDQDQYLLQVLNTNYIQQDFYSCKSLNQILTMMYKKGHKDYLIHDEKVQYVTFQQQIDQTGIYKDYFPLLWFSFGRSENQILKYTINLPTQSQCYLRNILVIMIDIDGFISQQPQIEFFQQSSYKLPGLGLSYISLKGHIIADNGSLFKNYDI